jgi:pentatricopeptide repeat protein
MKWVIGICVLGRNTMIFGYAKVGKLKQARKLFNEIPQRENLG